MNSPISSALSATLGALLALASTGPLPGLALVLQGAGVGALIGTIVVLRLERRRRRSGQRVDADQRWTLVARWTILTATVTAATAVLFALLRP